MPATLGTAGALLLLVVPTGWLLARATGGTRDAFAAAFWGLAGCSLVGVVLAILGAFTVPALAAVLAAIAAASALAARRRPPAAAAAGGVRGTALAAGVAALVWCAPPFETFLAGADSTMYLNAGVHLAKEGTLAVADTALPALGPARAEAALQRIRGRPGVGPYVRLPGGLLVEELAHGPAYPAFFPLLPAWTGLASLLDPACAPLVAPLFAGLAVWAVALFAGELSGALAAGVAGLLFGAHFTLWWFGRFTMPETLACAFVFGGLVFVRRGELGAAGVMLGCAGLARTETALFAAAAAALWLAWQRARPRAAALALGFAVPALVAAAAGASLPSHHYAYLRNDLAPLVFRVAPRWRRWRADGTLALAAAGTTLLAGLVGVLAWRRPTGFGRTFARGVTLAAVLAAVAAYAVLGGATSLGRNLAWLAAYGGWATLVLGPAGVALVWRRGGPSARLFALLWCLMVAVFLLNPRVAAWHPWAMRRFLPVVLPGLAIGVAAVLAGVARRGRGAAAAALALAAVLAWQALRPVLAVRDVPFFAGTWKAAATVAALVPEDAVVVIDAQFASLQLQVPLWLAHGRETLMPPPGQRLWRDVVTALLAAGRRVYWITNRYGTRADPGPLALTPAGTVDVSVRLPEAPVDGPPARAVSLVVGLALYSVGAGEAAGVGDGTTMPPPP